MLRTWLASPTNEDFQKREHILRYLKGAISNKFQVRPDVRTVDGHTILELETHVDSD